MDKHKDNGILLMNENLIEYCREVVNMGGEPEKELFNSVYNDLAEVFGIDTAIQIYQMYKGTQISFPTRLFNPDYVRKQVPKEYDGTNIKQLAMKYGYSEKTIRRMINEV